jgi:hypothetical protein
MENIRKTEIFVFLLQGENGNGTLLVVCYKRYRKTDVCVRWLAKDKR